MKLLACPLNGPRNIDEFVMGRPLRAAPDPRKAAEDIQARIAKVFA